MNTHKLDYQTRMSLNLKIMKFECSSTKLVICKTELNTNKSRLEKGPILVPLHTENQSNEQ